MSNRRTITRGEWWQQYGLWQSGTREGPLCVECAATIPTDQALSLEPDAMLCEQCREEEAQ